MTQSSAHPLLKDEDLKIEVVHPHPPGGQHVGTDTGVRVIHLPTGLTAECNIGMSQHRNRSVAMDMILGGLTSPHMR